MGLRADVIHELSALDSSKRALRKFGLLVGGVFALIALLGLWKHWSHPVVLAFGGLAAFLIVFGAVAPEFLRSIHRRWMTFALALGWCMSRIILTLLFGLVIVPFAFLGRVLRLPFTKMRRASPQDSYWLDHPARVRQHHTDMF
ncbi:MAG TPA: SxtJ family membrane protein [Prosthecobacter sp.]|nr:SxtJ family membrane protein [Prosthecobacter sp.]